MKIRKDIKSKLKKMRKSAADLSRSISVNYEMLNRYLNGRAAMPPAVEEKVKAKIDEWNSKSSK